MSIKSRQKAIIESRKRKNCHSNPKILCNIHLYYTDTLFFGPGSYIFLIFLRRESFYIVVSYVNQGWDFLTTFYLKSNIIYEQECKYL